MMEENQKEWQETELNTDSQTPEDGAREAMEQLQEMNRKLREENERLRSLPLKERPVRKDPRFRSHAGYFIGCMCVLFVIVVILGMMNS